VVVVEPDVEEELVLLAVAESMEILTGALKDTPLRVPAKVPVKEYCIFTAADAPPVSDPMAIKVAASVPAETEFLRRFFLLVVCVFI
jgi:hypothetical protein